MSMIALTVTIKESTIKSFEVMSITFQLLTVFNLYSPRRNAIILHPQLRFECGLYSNMGSQIESLAF